jgi:hypothetical protein
MNFTKTYIDYGDSSDPLAAYLVDLQFATSTPPIEENEILTEESTLRDYLVLVPQHVEEMIEQLPY